MILMMLTAMLSSTIFAAPIPYALIFERCSEQYLTKPEGTARNEWATKCFPKTNFDMYTAGDPGMYALVYSPSANSWKGPTQASAVCGDWQLKAMCVFACYPAGEEVLFENGYQSLDEAIRGVEDRLMVLDPASSLDDPQLVARDVYAFTRSFAEDFESIRTFTAASGEDISVTLNHPVLLSNGIMIEARDVQVGDRLVSVDGYPDPVVDIEDELYFGRVYNVAPKSRDLKENIVVAEGFLMGSAAYQYTARFQKAMGRRLFD